MPNWTPRALLVALLLTLVANPSRAELKINEVNVQADEWFEIMNTGPDTVSANGWGFCFREISGACHSLFGLIPPNGLKSYSMCGGCNYFPDYGGELYLLHYASRTKGDTFSYGILGGAPVGRGTIFRFPDGHDTDDHARDFEFLPTSHFGLGTRGTPNSATSPQLGSDLVLNEVKWHSHLTSEISAIEVFNPTGHDADLFGYWISDGDGVCQITVHLTVPAGGVQVIRQGVPGQGLDCTGVDEITFDRIDNIYLYRPPADGEPFPVRVDQLGILTDPAVLDPTQSFQRCPDGAGPNDGYDFGTSGGGVTLFFDTPSLGSSNNTLCVVQTRTGTWGRIKSIYR